MFYSMWYNAPKLLLAGGLERGGTDCVFGTKDVAVRGGTDCVFGTKDAACLEQHPSCRTHSQCLRVPGHRPATTLVPYTTSCKTQSSAPEDGKKIARNMLS